jgi:hypothetical protein
MKNGLRLILTVVLLSLFLSSEIAAAFSWWQAAGSAAAGAATGAVVGSVVPGLGTLVGAGVGALAGFISDSVVQLLSGAPSTSQNATLWKVYAEDAFTSISQQSQLIADQEISQVNLLQQAQLPFTLTAQKWEQVNYNENISPTSPYEFYQMLQQTGFLSYAAKLVGGTQSLWISEQAEINAVNQQINPYGFSIQYNTNPSGTVTIYQLNGQYVVIVIGNITVALTGGSIPIYRATAQGLQTYTTVVTQNYYGSTTLGSGVYVIDGNPYTCLEINPDQGMALVFSYSGSSYTAANWGFAEPSSISLTQSGVGTLESTNLPQPSASLAVVAEQVAIAMEGAAQTEYTVLKQLGYSSASQIPANMTLPTLNLNIGNFSNFTSSLQAYNLYLSMYTRELLQLEQTLQELNQQGKLVGLQELNFNTTNPLSLYGQYGGFIENGTIVLPNGQELHGLYLIQPYGGPLSLGPNGGTIGSGGAIAYQLMAEGNGTYGLGEEFTLPSGTVVSGHVQNPGTLGTVNQPQNANYLNTTTYQMPYTTTSSSLSTAFSNLLSYLESHPIALLVTIFFGLIIIVVIIRAIA